MKNKERIRQTNSNRRIDDLGTETAMSEAFPSVGLRLSATATSCLRRGRLKIAAMFMWFTSMPYERGVVAEDARADGRVVVRPEEKRRASKRSLKRLLESGFGLRAQRPERR